MHQESKTAQRLKESSGLRAKAPIAAQFEDCVQVFQRLSDSLQVNQFKPELERISKECALRFKLWGESSGASSRVLDYALKGSPLLKRQVLSLLGELNSTLGEALSGVLSQEPEDIDVGNATEALITVDLPDSIKFKDEAIADDQDPDSSPDMTLEEAKDIIGYLVQLLPVLRDPLDEAAAAATQDNDGYSVNDFKQLATLLFPQAPKDLIHRMGENNWMRWQSIRPLFNGDNSLAEQPANLRSVKRTIPPWDRPSQRVEIRHRYNSDKHESTIADDDAETSTARSHMDTVLSRTALPDQDSNTSGTDAPVPSILQHLVLPPPPFDFNATEPFECPYCHFELPLAFSSGRMDMKEWSAHVYRDLKAYMCTCDHCPYDYRPFGDKEEWIKHEINSHRSPVVWFCGLCRTDFENESHFITHIQSSHFELSSDHQSFVQKYSKRYSQKVLFEKRCVLCEAVCKDIIELESHLAHHQETFALAALLSDEVRDEESIEGDDRIVDYIAGLPEFQDRNIIALLAGAQKRQDKPFDAASINADTNRVEDTIESSGVDGFENAPGNTELWNDKVKKFLNKQPTKDSGPAVHFNVRSRYDNFVGRDVDLQNIRDCLSAQGRICTVSGRGGIGKTATAVEYLHKFGSDYSYVFWVEAENSGQCADQYGMIAGELNLAEKPLADSNTRTYFVRENLAKSEYRWLLIFDNVDSWSDIAHYIPRNIHKTKGSILITTRSGPLLPIPPVHPAYHHQYAVELDVWPLEHGREFLLSSTQPSYSRENLQSHGEYELAAKVVEIVGRLPLAISMIVGYVKVSRCTLADFLEMWEEKEHIMKKTKRRRKVDLDEGDIDAAIDSLWTIGIREVRMNSRRLLDIISFLDPETIPKSFLVGDHKEDCLEFLNSSETLSYKRMINELIGRRLLTEKKTSAGETAYTIHRLLQHKILQDMDDYGFADAFRKAFLLIRNRFPVADAQQLPDPKKWSICQIYLPHISTLHNIYQQNATSSPFGDPEPAELARLFYDAGYHIWSRQSTAHNGLQYLKTAEKILDDIKMDPNAKIRADILCVTGLLLLNMGCVERRQGFTLLDRALQIRKKIYDQVPEHNNDVLLQNAANDHALCLLNEHHFEKAGVTFRECRERYLVWGPESENPFENSKYYGNYSVVLMWKGDMDKAIDYQRHASMLIEKFIGRKASYYRKLFMLACVLLQSGDLQGALDTHLEVLTARLELLGKHDDFTISSMYAVGAMYHHLGDPVTATEYILQSIEYAKSSWWDRAALARAQYHLSLLYREQSIQEDAAIALEKQAQTLLDDFGDHAAESVQALGDKMMILDDLQPTFLGRYTGRKLLKHLQEFYKQK